MFLEVLQNFQIIYLQLKAGNIFAKTFILDDRPSFEYASVFLLMNEFINTLDSFWKLISLQKNK